MTTEAKAAFQAVADQFATEFVGGTFDVDYIPATPTDKITDTFTHTA